MAATLVKKVMLRIAADDGDTEAKLDKISAKADELARKHPDLKVKIDTAAASAKLAALRMELKRTDDEAKDGGGRMSAFGQALNGLTFGLSGGVGQMTMFQKVMLGLNLATGFGEPLVAGLAVAVGGLASGLVAGGGALGAFGLLAKSNLTAAGTAASQVQTAQVAYNAAIAHGTKQATAYRAEQIAIAKAYAQLSPAQIQLSKQVGGISNQWQKFSASFAGPTSTIVGQLRPLVTSVLPDIRKLAMAGETGLSSMLSVLSSKGTGGLDKFVTMMADNAPAAIMRLGVAIGHIITGIGGILKAFMPVSGGLLAGLDNITARFAKWGQTLSGHSGFQSMMAMFKSETPLAVHALGQLATLIKTVVASMAGMGTFSNSKLLLQTLNLLLPALNRLAKVPGLVSLILYLKLAADAGGKLKTAFSGIQAGFGVFKSGASAVQDLSAGMSNSAAAASEATGAWGTFGGKLSSMGSSVASFVSATVSGLRKAAVATAAWIAEHAVAAGAFIAENVTMAVSATAAFIAENAATLGLVAGIGLLVAGIVYLATHWKQTWKAIKTVAVDAWHFIDSEMIRPLTRGIGDLVDFIKGHWKILATVLGTMLLGPVGGLVIFIATHWQQIRSLTSRLVSDVTGFFRSLPGRIVSALSGLGTMLFGLGEHAISSLMNGLGSMMGGLIGKAESWGHDIANALGSPFGIHFSEPSEASKMVMAGRRIALGLGAGMDSGNSAVRASAARLASSAGISGSAAGAGAGQLEVTLILPKTGNAYIDSLFEDLRAEVRHRGGGGVHSAQKAWGERWPSGA